MTHTNYGPSAQVSLQLIADALMKLEPRIYKDLTDSEMSEHLVKKNDVDPNSVAYDAYSLDNTIIKQPMLYSAVAMITQDRQRGAEPEPLFTVIKMYDPYYFTEDRVTNKVLKEPMIRDSFRFPGVVITEAQALEVAQFIAANHHKLVGFGFPISSAI